MADDPKPVEPLAAARPIIEATKKAVADGNEIVRKTREQYDLEEGGAGDGPLMRAWKRGELPKRSMPTSEPLSDGREIGQMIAHIIAFERQGRWIAAAMGCATLRRHYDRFEPDDLEQDEKTWTDFANKYLPFGADKANELIGRMVHRGGMMHCTKCRTGATCPCACGVAYWPEHPWAARPVEPIEPSALDRAIAAIKVSPEKSNRAIAAEIHVSDWTVRQARQQFDKTADNLAVDHAVDVRIGRDGRRRKVPSQPKPLTLLSKDDGDGPDYEAVCEFLNELLTFNADFTNRLRNWLDDRQLSAEHGDVLQDRLHGCANDLHEVAQEIFHDQDGG